MFRTIYTVSIALLCAAAVVPAAEHSQVITVDDYTYEIDVGGFRDPVNETIIIENLGDTPLVNPRITVDGKYDWFDLESIAREATRGCTTDEERAYAIFNFVRNNSHHRGGPGDQETFNSVVYFNVYGYANCGYHATISVALAKALGMKARVWEVWHHTVNEFWFNNRWNMLDSDIEAYYLMDDNRTVASIADLWADQRVTGGKGENAHLTKFSERAYGIHRQYTDVEGTIGWDYKSGNSSLGGRYFFAEDHCYVSTGYDYFGDEFHDMAMTIRPDEKLIRNWKGGNKFYNYKRYLKMYENDPETHSWPIRRGDGQIIWTPDLTRPDARNAAEDDYNVLWGGDNASKPAVYVKNKQGGVWDVASFVDFAIKTPYTITGGKLKAKVHRAAAGEWDRLSLVVSSDKIGWERQNLWRAPRGATGDIDVDVDLDEHLYPTGMRGKHNVQARFQFTTDENNKPATQTGVESLSMTADIQCAPNSLPALALGKNVIRYRDETPGPHKVKITHVWRELNDTHPPEAPAKAVYPKDGATVKGRAPKFKWAASKDADKGDKITDYYINISFDPQCRWPISTTLLTETGSDKAEWQLPDGWLNPNTTYYWTVKAKDSKGIWGKWSKPFRFKTGG
ncbi:transglutaminase-like domain-containing protein [candidate division KSB1 bacterium]